MPTLVVNLQKDTDRRLGVHLQDTPHGVVVHSLDSFPHDAVRRHVQEGDVLLSINGAPARGARTASRRIVRTGPDLSLCLRRGGAGGGGALTPP